MISIADLNGHGTALVVSTAFTDFPRTGAKRGHGYRDAKHKIVILAEAADHIALVLHQTARSGRWCLLLDKIRKFQFEVGTTGLKMLFHITQHGVHAVDTDLAMILIEYLDEATHVGALEVVGQVNIHVDARNRLLLLFVLVHDDDRVADILNADLVDGDVAIVVALLHVRHAAGVAGGARGV